MIPIQISLKFVHNNQAMVSIMAWLLIGDKPLSEPLLVWFSDAALAGVGVGVELNMKVWYAKFMFI